jgi:16S rRNA (uracil1498-N3)-methyltransferase
MPQRYFVEELNQEITGNDLHHIVHVMRMKTNDEVIVCHESKCFLVILNVEQHKVTYQIKSEIEPQLRAEITLIQGLPKGSKTEFIAKYATIFGVSNIIFLEMQRSIAKIENEDNKLRRLSSIAKEAAELAHRNDVPNISFVKHIQKIDLKSFDIVLLADENYKSKTLNEVLPHVDKTHKIAVIIGPEGGITDTERAYLEKEHVVFVSLGELIFPTEAACLPVLSYITLKNT